MQKPSTISFGQNSYAGDVSPKAAWEVLAANQEAVLVDVRTSAEWVFAGVPNLSTLNKEPLLISWRIYPSMERNSGFEEVLEQEVPNKAAPIYFLCKVGGRSREAAMAMAARGYSTCYNITGGFEGEPDAKQHRGCITGWKADNLPWEQQ
ncbi:MAG: Rhodanese domain protein [Rickettsiales bacterium]|nr:Rhodanese domain protein [Rickettsiales bacterium]